ncbi:hypothetical protein Dimus_016013, partial [Dionaea muscipula]
LQHCDYAMATLRSFGQATFRPNSFGTWSASELIFTVSSTYGNLSKNHISGFIPSEFGNLRSIVDM